MDATTDITTAPRIYPIVRYDDAIAAMDFLVEAFGFVIGEVNEGPDGKVAHAQVGYDTGVVMIGTRKAEPNPFDHGTLCLYVAVDDADAHHARAVEAGAKIVMELTDQDYGSRDYAAEDPGGNVWCFGTYRPGPPG